MRGPLITSLVPMGALGRVAVRVHVGGVAAGTLTVKETEYPRLRALLLDGEERIKMLERELARARERLGEGD